MAKQTVTHFKQANLFKLVSEGQIFSVGFIKRCTQKDVPVAASECADGDLAFSPHHVQEVVRFLQNRLRAERQNLVTELRHLAETTGCLHVLTLVHIALLENDIIGTERLLKNVH
jgi:hypothetical protein